MYKIEPNHNELTYGEKKAEKLDAYYKEKLNVLLHEHFQKITPETTQEQLESILKEGNKKWLEICARSRATDKKLITLNINAFTDFLKDSMNKK